MERCGFFDANLVGDEYDRVYLADQFAAYFASFIGNGVFAEHSNQLQVVEMETPQMQIGVERGQAWINGYWYENTDMLYLPIDIADGVLNRIDSVVLRLGLLERNIWLTVKKGTPALNPVAPKVTRTADYYELQLATISIPAGSTKITQAQITDTRMNQDVCGWVTGVVKQLDTTTLFNQFESYFDEFKQFYENEYANWTAEQKQAYITWITLQKQDYEDWTAEQKAEYDEWYASHIDLWQNEFTTWFENIKGQLSEDAAGNLQNQIDNIVNGNTKVGHSVIADTATTADTATHADTATTADNAIHANTADEAIHADSANTADNATYADEASHAIIASSANNGPILVDNYGAKGDGQTDDTAAIQAALNAAYEAGGGTVLFKSGKTYLISQALYVRDNTTIIAYGATIRNITNGGELLVNQLQEETISGFNGHSNIAVFGGIWDCNAYNGHDGVNVAGNDGMAFTHAWNITLRDVIIKDTANFHALEFNAIHHAIVRNCKFLGWSNTQNNPNYTTKEAIQIDVALEGAGLPAYDGTLCNDILIDGCIFYKSERCGAPPRGVGSHTTYNNDNHINIRIVNNKFHGLPSYAVAPWYWMACIIANNDFWGCGGGVYSENALHNSIINNNVIVSPADTGIGLRQSHNNIVCNNKIEYATNNGIALAGSDSNTITNNYIKGVTNDYGIILGPIAQTDEGNKISSNNNYVFGNFIRDASKAGIRLSANATDNTISSNKCKSITFDASAKSCLVINNDLTGYGQTLEQAIVTNGANPQVANNYV